MTECGVCILKFNKSTLLPVKCLHCEYTACRSCYITYINNSNINADCMSCHKQMSHQFMLHNFTKVYINGDYKKHREDVLFDKERSLIPATQVYVKEKLEKTRIKKENSELLLQQKKLNKEANIIYGQLKNIDKTIQIKKYNAIAEVYNKLREDIELTVAKIHQLEEIYFGIHVNQNGELIIPTIDINTGSVVHKVVSTTKGFTRKCPIPNCHGYLDKQYQCGICTKHICKDCNECIKLDHTCDPETVKTIKLINKDSKPCPKCGIMICKVSGCNQMWCIDCHTTFDWATGRLETGVQHNPHYYEYLRRTGAHIPRNPGDIVGGDCNENELVPFNSLNRLFAHLFEQFNKPMCNYFFEFYRTVSHYIGMEKVMWPILNTEVESRTHRIEYIMGFLSETNFRKEIINLNLKNERNTEINHIFDMLINVSIGLYRNLYNKYNVYIDNMNDIPYPTLCIDLEDTIDSMVELINIFNESILKFMLDYKTTARISGINDKNGRLIYNIKAWFSKNKNNNTTRPTDNDDDIDLFPY